MNSIIHPDLRNFSGILKIIQIIIQVNLYVIFNLSSTTVWLAVSKVVRGGWNG
ncbi:unnamed protein product [Nezara viridula]|uniref:Uncharacterized protein n=1 Tax=Nezara viridula TaxID=85310 RepID=A0A9P0HDQ5_NEZVI|nr:unnamed protein product [Nezara viridula]